MNLVTWCTARATELRRLATWETAVSVALPDREHAGCVINVDGRHVIGQFIVWPTGAMEATAASVETGQMRYTDGASNLDAAALAERWQRFRSAITRIEEGDAD